MHTGGWRMTRAAGAGGQGPVAGRASSVTLSPIRGPPAGFPMEPAASQSYVPVIGMYT